MVSYESGLLQYKSYSYYKFTTWFRKIHPSQLQPHKLQYGDVRLSEEGRLSKNSTVEHRNTTSCSLLLQEQHMKRVKNIGSGYLLSAFQTTAIRQRWFVWGRKSIPREH